MVLYLRRHKNWSVIVVVVNKYLGPSLGVKWKRRDKKPPKQKIPHHHSTRRIR